MDKNYKKIKKKMCNKKKIKRKKNKKNWHLCKIKLTF